MKVALWIVGGFIVISGTGFFFLMKEIREDVVRQYSQASEEPLVDIAYLLAGILEDRVAKGQLDVNTLEATFERALEKEFVARIHDIDKTRIQTDVYVTDESGIVIFDSDAGSREGEDYSRYNDVYLARRGKYGARASREDVEDHRTTVFYVAVPIHHDGKLMGTLTVFRPETAMAPFVDQSRTKVLTSSVKVAAAVVLLAMAWAFLILSPIRKLTSQAARVAQGEADRFEATGVGEFKRLGLALEEMRRELEGKHYVESYIQGLTHELKSPLAAIRGAAELIDDSMPDEKRQRFLDNILIETTRSEDMVRRLVQLASIESQNQLDREAPFCLSEMIAEELASFQSLMEARELEFESSCVDSEIEVTGEPLMVRIAVRNLINNAVDFSPPKESVGVALTREGNEVVLAISDRGPGVPDYAEGRVFDRFYSLKNEVTGRKGSGIGLSFVRSVMRLHGGVAELTNRADGGTRAKLVFSAEGD
ncbi:MAG: two-component system sensor histidine kinase CreC [Verrucomicrobiota bacterium]